MAHDAKQRAAVPGARTVVVPLRPCLAVAALVFLALAMSSSRPNGFVCGYTPLTFVEAVAAGALGMAACLVRPRSWEFPVVFGRGLLLAACLVPAGQAACRFLEAHGGSLSWGYIPLVAIELGLAARVVLAPRAPASSEGGVLGALALFLSAEAILYCDVNQPADIDKRVTILLVTMFAASAAGFLLTASLLAHVGEAAVRRRRLLVAQVVLLFAAGAVLRYAAAVVCEDPGMDVLRAEQGAADRLVSGRNPYTGDYFDKGAPFYPPLPFLVAAPFRALGWDVRLGNVVCDLIAALALFATAGRGRGGLTGALLGAAYLHFPRVPLLMELAWYEPMLAAALGGGWWLAARGWRVGYFVMGLGLTGKQYAVVLLPALWKGLGGRRVALLLGTAGAAAVVVLPFYLWDRRAFVERVIDFHVEHEVRHDGVTIQAAAKDRFKTELPRTPMTVAALLLIGLIAWRAPSEGMSPAPWMATGLIVFCLFYTQAFLNYFYLCAYLMLLGLGEWFSRDVADS